MSVIKIIECPRDAMQGMKQYIPASVKAGYINKLLKAGFDTIDFGSFVSPSVVPQMRDTAEVLSMLDLSQTRSKLLAIVANKRGAEIASGFSEISYLGYPFSISETFQRRNTNSGITESLETVDNIIEICSRSGKEPVIYISMGFGNPYGDEWTPEIACGWVRKLAEKGIKIISLADTVGVSDPQNIDQLFSTLIPEFPDVELGAHLHSRPADWKAKIQSAWNSGCRRFDTAIMGFGGCPMAKDELVGNIATENLVMFLDQENADHNLDMNAFKSAIRQASAVFSPLVQNL